MTLDKASASYGLGARIISQQITPAVLGCTLENFMKGRGQSYKVQDAPASYFRGELLGIDVGDRQLAHCCISSSKRKVGQAYITLYTFAISIAPALAMTVNFVPSRVSVVACALLGSPDEPAIPALTTLLANVET